MIRNIAVKGGGIKGVAYVGALEVLEQNGHLQEIQRCAGTSAGAMLASMLALGFDASEVRELMLSVDFKKFKTGWNPLRIFKQYGLYSGDYILNFIHDYLRKSKHKFPKNVTFKEMRDAGCRDLYVFACNVNAQTATEFSPDTTPHARVAEAVRASMSIPFFFKAFRFSNGIPDKHLYVDGGIVYNYPLSFFDSERFNTSTDPNPETLGLYLYAPGVRPHSDLADSRPLYFTRQLFESLLDAQDVTVSVDQEIMGRSIRIDDLHYPSTDFDLGKKDIERLIESGKKGAQEYLKNMKSAD